MVEGLLPNELVTNGRQDNSRLCDSRPSWKIPNMIGRSLMGRGLSCPRALAVGQLVNAEYFPTPGARPPLRQVDYTYDALGNRERLAEVDRTQRGPERITTARYTANHGREHGRCSCHPKSSGSQ